MKCEYCGTAIPDGAEECPACGAGITIQTEKPADGENASGRKTIKCRKCKTENDSTMQFCGHCGEKLDPDLISSKCGGREFDAAALERAKAVVRAAAEAKLNDAIRAAKEERDSEVRKDVLLTLRMVLGGFIFWMIFLTFKLELYSLQAWSLVFRVFPWDNLLLLVLGMVLLCRGFAWFETRSMNRKIERITRETETELEAQLAFLNENPELAGKESMET